MKILVYGAGVIGSVYAAHLQQGGHEVSLLARGRRLSDLREHGVLLENAVSGERAEAKVSVVERLEPADVYDLIIVAMQKGHVGSVLPSLAANGRTPTVMFVGNNAAGADALCEAIGEERVLMGFPGFGGYFDGPRVHFAAQGRAAKLDLTLGEPSGRITVRLRTIETAFAHAGIKVVLERDIDAWLKAHVALVVPIVFGLHRHGDDNEALAQDRPMVRLLAEAVREGLRSLRSLGHRIVPFRLATILWLPTKVSAFILHQILASDFAKVAFAGHAAAAGDEFDLLLDELRDMTDRSGLPTPALDELTAPSSPRRRSIVPSDTAAIT